MEFIGRKEELNTLFQLYHEVGLKGAIVYGRRRFGKTSLLLESSKSFPGKVIFYQCLRMTDKENAKQLFLAVKMIFPEAELLGDFTFLDVLQLIFRLSENVPVLLILDEYCYLKDRDGIDSYLQSLIDHHLDFNLKIVLSGSIVDVMEHLLDADHPLHGRFLYKICLQAFDYYDSSLFYPKVSLEDKIKYYSVLGGIPYYLSMIDVEKTFEENLEYLFLSSYAPITNEIQTTLQEEFSKIDNAAFLISLVLSGKHSYTDIKQAFYAQVKNSDVNYILTRLTEMGFVSKRYAINDDKRKSAYYEIEDNLFAFFYHIINPKFGLIHLMTPEMFYKNFIEKRMNQDFIPHRFEKICQEFLIRKNKSGKLNPFFYQIGSYTYNDSKKKIHGQFDLVTMDEKGNIVYECKYTKEKITSAVVNEEKRQLKECNVPYYQLGFFSKSGFDLQDKEDYLCYTLEDMFDL